MNQSTYNLLKQFELEYKRTGKNSAAKQLQIRRLYIFVDDVLSHEKVCAGNIEKTGKRAVVRFWQRHKHLSDKTRYEYFRIIKRFWLFIGKPEPAEPFYQADAAAHAEQQRIEQEEAAALKNAMAILRRSMNKKSL